MNKLFGYILAIFVGIVAIGCDDEEENTGNSTLVKSNPTISIDVSNPDVSFIEKDSTFSFTVTLSTPQIVDVAVNLVAVGGDATEGEDFSTASTVIPAGTTSGVVSVKVLADAVPEETETFSIQIGDDRTANASFTTATVNFTILNVSEGDLPVTLSWAATVYDVAGQEVPPADVADLILFITDLDGNVVGEIDGSGFESVVFNEGDPDGDYLLKAGFFAILDPGELGEIPDFDLNLAYSQVGVSEETNMIFPKAMAPVQCDWNIFTMAKVTKSGATYTVTRVGEFEFNLNNFTGDYACDEPGYDVYPVTFTIKDCETITNDNFWDSGFSIDYVLDIDAGTVTIPLQEENGGAQLGIITIEGSGTFDAETYGMVVHYVVKRKANGAIVDDNTHTFEKP